MDQMMGKKSWRALSSSRRILLALLSSMSRSTIIPLKIVLDFVARKVALPCHRLARCETCSDTNAGLACSFHSHRAVSQINVGLDPKNIRGYLIACTCPLGRAFGLMRDTPDHHTPNARYKQCDLNLPGKYVIFITAAAVVSPHNLPISSRTGHARCVHDASSGNLARQIARHSAAPSPQQGCPSGTPQVADARCAREPSVRWIRWALLTRAFIALTRGRGGFGAPTQQTSP